MIMVLGQKYREVTGTDEWPNKDTPIKKIIILQWEQERQYSVVVLGNIDYVEKVSLDLYILLFTKWKLNYIKLKECKLLIYIS